MAGDQLVGATAWIAVSPDTDPLVDAHIQHAEGQVLGEAHRGDDWREALAWARARTDRVYIRFDYADTTYWGAPAHLQRIGTRPSSRCRTGP
jgi:hypothetical protein